MEMVLTPKEECILHIAQMTPFLPALRFGDEAWSYSNLWKRVLGLAIKIGQVANAQKAVGIHMGCVVYFTYILLLATYNNLVFTTQHGARVLHSRTRDLALRS